MNSMATATSHLPRRHAARASERVTVDGDPGTILYSTTDGDCAVRFDGCGTTHLYPSARCVAARDDARILRIERLIGTDESKGLRGDLAWALKAKAAGYSIGAGGDTLDEEIAGHERALAAHRATLATLQAVQS